MKKWQIPVLASALALAAPGCIIVDDDDSARDVVGVLTVEWTIAGFQDPRDCVELGIDRFELVLFDPAAGVVEEFEPFCEDFSVSIDLFEGYYYARVTLVDSFDDAATFSETLEDLYIEAGTELIVPVDFPPGSFL